MLHLSYGEQETDEPRNDDNQSDQGSSSASPNVVGCGMVNRTVHCKPTIQVILATVVVHVNDSSGNVMRCRAVLDSGSQLCFITNKLANANDFEGKISLHKDASMAPGDCRIEWKNGGIERSSHKMLEKIDNLLDDKSQNNKERDNG